MWNLNASSDRVDSEVAGVCVCVCVTSQLTSERGGTRHRLLCGFTTMWGIYMLIRVTRAAAACASLIVNLRELC